MIWKTNNAYEIIGLMVITLKIFKTTAKGGVDGAGIVKYALALLIMRFGSV